MKVQWQARLNLLDLSGEHQAILARWMPEHTQDLRSVAMGLVQLPGSRNSAPGGNRFF